MACATLRQGQSWLQVALRAVLGILSTGHRKMAENTIRTCYLREVLCGRTAEAAEVGHVAVLEATGPTEQNVGKYSIFNSKNAAAQGIRLILGDQHVFSMGIALRT